MFALFGRTVESNLVELAGCPTNPAETLDGHFAMRGLLGKPVKLPLASDPTLKARKQTEAKAAPPTGAEPTAPAAVESAAPAGDSSRESDPEPVTSVGDAPAADLLAGERLAKQGVRAEHPGQQGCRAGAKPGAQGYAVNAMNL